MFVSRRKEGTRKQGNEKKEKSALWSTSDQVTTHLCPSEIIVLFVDMNLGSSECQCHRQCVWVESDKTRFGFACLCLPPSGACHAIVAYHVSQKAKRPRHIRGGYIIRGGPKREKRKKMIYRLSLKTFNHVLILLHPFTSHPSTRSPPSSLEHPIPRHIGICRKQSRRLTTPTPPIRSRHCQYRFVLEPFRVWFFRWYQGFGGRAWKGV